MRDSEIHHSRGGSTYAGTDAVNTVRAFYLASALDLYAKTKMQMTIGATPTAMLKLATQITGKPYKRGAYTQAAEDVRKWATEMRDSIPTTIDGERA